MSNKSEKEKQKQTQEKCQIILGQLLREEDNKYCVDCDAKGPRWASWNLGIFLCIRCAGIHRNLGVHISRVKSVNLDTWTPEQVACLQQMGNSKARAVYEANLPDNFRRPQNDSSLEAFVRSKYEQKKYIAKEWVQPPMPKPAFNIEEDYKKEREKKRRSKGLATIDILPIQHPAALPRPHSNANPTTVGGGSPSSLKSKDKPTLQENTHQHKNSSSAVDLLGLDAPTPEPAPVPTDDPFDSFMSAPVATNNSQGTANSDASQSEQSSEILKRNILSKESILSLYGNSAAAPPQQPVFGVPGGVYLGQQMFIPQAVNWQGAILPDGIMRHPNAQSTNNMPATNPFLAMAVPGFHGPQQSALLMDPANNMVLAGQVPTALGQVQQQMASLNLGNQMPNVMAYQNNQQAAGHFIRPTSHTLSTNLWQ